MAMPLQTHSSVLTAQHLQPALTPEQPAPRPSSAWLFGSLFFTFLTALIGLFAILQLLFFDGEMKTLPLIVWNALLAIGQIGICIGAWRRETWGRNWAIGTSSLQLVTLSFAAITSPLPAAGLALLLVGAGFALTASVGLRLASADFPKPIELSPEDGGLLEVPRKIDPSTLITFVLLVIAVVLHVLSNADLG